MFLQLGDQLESDALPLSYGTYVFCVVFLLVEDVFGHARGAAWAKGGGHLGLSFSLARPKPCDLYSLVVVVLGEAL